MKLQSHVYIGSFNDIMNIIFLGKNQYIVKMTFIYLCFKYKIYCVMGHI